MAKAPLSTLISSLLLIALSFALSGCGDDDPGEVTWCGFTGGDARTWGAAEAKPEGVLIRSDGTLAPCKTSCEELPECTGFDYGNVNQCWLKTNGNVEDVSFSESWSGITWEFIANSRATGCDLSRQALSDCAGSYGAKVGDPVCCGQPGTIAEAGRICGAGAPTCEGFIHLEQWGKCTVDSDAFKFVDTTDTGTVATTTAPHAGCWGEETNYTDLCEVGFENSTGTAACVYGDHCMCKDGLVCSDSKEAGECAVGSGGTVRCVESQ